MAKALTFMELVEIKMHLSCRLQSIEKHLAKACELEDETLIDGWTRLFEEVTRLITRIDEVNT